ncbi:extracellular solute-binding protein [Paenibacillus sp. J31TS4]|uniref:extracellular solute-binding protein n=1 Tax=Paenibacillus sp. J31TS4 TaxID=2807195 RepID=UPI001BCBFFA6|nr:extracellular solute-binding protein [Paenibacillus sp. J31TS4]
MAKTDRKTFQSRSNELLTTVRGQIARGDYKPGEFLPAETALAAEFQLSKNSVRLVLEKLVNEGLLLKIPRVGNQVTAPSAQTVIRIGLYPSMQDELPLDRLLEKFREKHPLIRVETMTLPYAHADHIRQLLEMGVVDAATMNYTDYLHFKEEGMLGLLEPFTPESDTYPFLTSLFSDEEARLRVRPLIFSPVILCYNKEHFASRRVLEPDGGWTWQDLRGALSRLTGLNRFGLYFHLSSTNRWPLFLLQCGARFVRDRTGAVVPAGEGMMRGIRFLRELMHKDGLFPLAMSFTYQDAEKLFLEQKVSVILTTYYRLNQLVGAGFPYDIAQVPRTDNQRTLLLSTGIAVSAASRSKEAAVLFSDFLVSEEAQASIRHQSFSLPASKWVTETVACELPDKPARLELHRELIPNYATHRDLQLTMREVEVLGTCLEQYFSRFVEDDGLIALFNHQLLQEG